MPALRVIGVGYFQALCAFDVAERHGKVYFPDAVFGVFPQMRNSQVFPFDGTSFKPPSRPSSVLIVRYVYTIDACRGIDHAFTHEFPVVPMAALHFGQWRQACSEALAFSVFPLPLIAFVGCCRGIDAKAFRLFVFPELSCICSRAVGLCAIGQCVRAPLACPGASFVVGQCSPSLAYAFLPHS